MENIKLILGDCLDKLKELPEDSVDSIVTDPPYGLSFMGKAWDHSVPSKEVWGECLRVLKPGGHLLSFSGTRTYHRMAVNIEDAGFEIRDQLNWIYGSGFPKSLDVSKAIDKVAGAEREIIGKVAGMGKQNPEWNGTAQGRAENSFKPEYNKTKPTPPDAQQWDGWGTALKPAHEPIVLARKPLIGTVAQNVLEHGTGGINIDGCRIGLDDDDRLKKGGSYSGNRSGSKVSSLFNAGNGKIEYSAPPGRYPANLIHDGSEEVVGLFPNTKSGASAAGGHKRSHENMRKGSSVYGNGRGIAGTSSTDDAGSLYGDSGSASRFFKSCPYDHDDFRLMYYCGKASKTDRDEGLESFLEKEAGIKNDSGRGFSESDPMKKIMRRNNHPTVKPTELMRYLVRLVTPLGGIVLDPFMGSGSTGKGAVLEGFSFIGIELDSNYIEIAQARIEYAGELKRKENREKINTIF